MRKKRSRNRDDLFSSSLGLTPDNLNRTDFFLLLRSMHSSRTYALITPELPRRQSGFKHLADLLQRSALDLRDVKVHKHCRDDAGWCPDVSVLWTPIERCGVDEVGRGEPWRCLVSKVKTLKWRKKEAKERSKMNGVGESYVASHAPKKPTDAARPNVYERRRCDGISPPETHA